MVKVRAPRGKTGSPARPPARRRAVPDEARAVRTSGGTPVESVDDLIEGALRQVAAKGPSEAHPEPGDRERRREEKNAAADARLLTQLKKSVDALLDKKADKLVVLNLADLTSMSDYFVIATATSDRQAQALADAVQEAMKSEGRRPSSVEGYPNAPWILLDYGDVVFHVFLDQARRFYGLERLWGDAPDATSSFLAAGPTSRR